MRGLQMSTIRGRTPFLLRKAVKAATRSAMTASEAFLAV